MVLLIDDVEQLNTPIGKQNWIPAHTTHKISSRLVKVLNVKSTL